MWYTLFSFLHTKRWHVLQTRAPGSRVLQCFVAVCVVQCVWCSVSVANMCNCILCVAVWCCNVCCAVCVMQCVHSKYAQVYSAFCKMPHTLFPGRKCDTHFSFSLTYGSGKMGGTMRAQLFHMKCIALCNTLCFPVENVTRSFPLWNVLCNTLYLKSVLHRNVTHSFPLWNVLRYVTHSI